MNLAVIIWTLNGGFHVVISDRHDQYMLERMQELAAAPDKDATLWVEFPTGGSLIIDGDSIVAALEVPADARARDVLADYLERHPR